MEVKAKKLHVAETLAKATKALEAHRSWMKRRSSAVAPIQLDEEDRYLSSSNNGLSEYNVTRSNGCVQRTSGKEDVVKKHPVKEQCEAPPPFIVSGKVLVEKTNHMGKEGTTKHSTQSFKLNGNTVAPRFKEKRHHYRLSQVAPSTGIVEGEPQSLANVGMFTASNVELDSFALGIRVHNAWGSQSALDEDKDSSDTREAERDFPTELDTSPSRSAHFTHGASFMTLQNRSPIQLDSRIKGESATASSKDNSMESIGSISNGGLHDNETSPHRSQDNLLEKTVLAELRANNPATVIPVSPAPLSQRSSHTVHTQSKLMAAENNVETLDVEVDSEGQVIHLHDNVLVNTANVVDGEYQDMPEADLRNVLPKEYHQNMKSAVVTTHPPVTVSSPVTSPSNSDLYLSGTDHYIQSSRVSSFVMSTVQSQGLKHNTSDDVGVSKALMDLNLPPLKTLLIDASDMDKQLPPLKLLQPPLLSPLHNEYSLSGKRIHSPPTYSIHRPQGGLALAPPCPGYGMAQLPSFEGLQSPSMTLEETDLALTTPTLPVDSPNTNSTLRPVPNSPQKNPVQEHATILSNRHPSSQHLASVSNRQYGSSINTIMHQEDGVESTSAVVADLTLSHFSSEDHNVINNLSVSQLPPGPGALHLAAKSGNLRKVQSLLSQGHDVDLPDHEGRTPLMYCIQSQGVHLSCADALITDGANVNKQTSDGSTAIHLAASAGAVSLIELMLLNGADPDVRDFEGRMPIHWATIQKGCKTVALLLKHSNLDVNVTDDAGMTPLMWAAYHNNTSLTSFLLENGADCEEKDIDGYTAMHWAVHRRSTKCLQLLLVPDRTFFKDHKGKTVFHLASEKGATGACELVLRMRPDAIYDTDKTGRTPLHYAAACSRVDVCALLLDRGCDASQRDSSGRTPLDYARMKKLDYVVALLTCHGSAVADFARASKTASINTVLSHSVSFSELPLTRSSLQSSEDDSSDLLSLSLSSLSMLKSRLVEEGQEDDVISQDSADSRGDTTQVVEDRGVDKGGYLGSFSNDRNDPVQHFYFWIKPTNGTLCWCRYRENATRNANEASILELHEGASNGVKNNPTYSPQDLHKYVFWVMTGTGVLDLFAYNQDAYTRWVKDIGTIAQSNSLISDKELLQRNVHSRSRNTNRPVSRRSTASRTSVSVAPIDMNNIESTTFKSPTTPTALKGQHTQQKLVETVRYDKQGLDIGSHQSEADQITCIHVQPVFMSTPLQSGVTAVTKVKNEHGFARELVSEGIQGIKLLMEEPDVI